MVVAMFVVVIVAFGHGHCSTVVANQIMCWETSNRFDRSVRLTQI